jgi:shikimate kinase
VNHPTPSILLVGLMGTGKSTVARQLSAKLGIDCLDTDKMVESRAGRTVRELFDQLGEATFRDIESEVLTECLSRQTPSVVAGAGGIVVRESNRAVINEARKNHLIVVVWLHASTDVLAQRTAKGGHRPLLDEDRAGTLSRLADERAGFYSELSDIVVDVSHRSVESTVALLVSAIEEGLREEGGNYE